MKIASLIAGLLGSFLMPVSAIRGGQLSSPVPQDMWAGSPLVSLLDNRIVLSGRTLIFDEFNLGPYADEVLSFNILRYFHYLKGDAEEFAGGENREPFEGSFVLNPGEVFAYHPEVLEEYRNQVAVTPETNLSMADGYKALEGLPANGVCYSASLFNWVASEAGLEIVAKVNHDFFPVPGVPQEYGTSIYHLAGSHSSRLQNLYIRNTYDSPVEFRYFASGRGVVLVVLTSII